MQIGNRFRCYPKPAQEQILLRWIGCQRHIYNAKVHEERYFRSFARKSLMHAGQQAPIDQQYSQFKTELTPWLSESFAMEALPTGEQSMTMTGMHRIDEAKLAALAPEKLYELMQQGILSRVFIHLVSLGNFARLLGRRAAR
jgi:hypothetical protein